TGRTSPRGLNEYVLPVPFTVIEHLSRSTETTSPVFKTSHRRSRHSQGYNSPVATEFRKKIRAKLSARTIRHPAEPSAIGACSRELPQPKFFPATTMGNSVLSWPSLTNRAG